MQQIDLPVRLKGADFRAMAVAMLGSDKPKIMDCAEAFGVGHASVQKMLAHQDDVVGNLVTKKLVARWNAFIENGGVVPDPEVDEPPFVPVGLVRDRSSGVIRRAEDVHPALIGARNGQIESEDDVEGRISHRFNIMESMMRRMIRGRVRSMIIQAAAGVGKTYRIEKILERTSKEKENFHYEVLSGGGVTPLGLYKSLYRARNGGILVLDDNDSLLEASNMEGMNLLKNSLDSADKRVLTWSKVNPEIYDVHSIPEDDEESIDGRIPSKFEFKGAMVFITNMDFQSIAEGNKKNSPHIKALIDRSFLVNLTIQTLRDKVIWCDHIFRNFMSEGMKKEVVMEVSAFVKDNQFRFFGISCRLYNDIIALAADPEEGIGWKAIIEATKFKAS